MIMSHRGTKGESIIGQVPMGTATSNILKALNLNYFNPKTPKEAMDVIANSWNLSNSKKAPISILLDINYW